ncbi:PHD finger protein 14 isoform X2 [Schistocerca americana]|uniref:PHD finger protein 14 isoform X2 n=1 Tax=Schistocerca americana TaxID=7009 RepID=UPI001F502D1E|nr:PHD finger protein 14 isoform X2 [Schistocerca americana]XP_049946359.1 PHD finger protein 14 isoform X2 [Schistocerca serialis cubense]
MSGFERDPNKRRVKPVDTTQQSLLDFDLGESSDDSDFRIEDHCEESDDDSIDSDDDGGGKDDDDDDDEDNGEDSDDSEGGQKNDTMSEGVTIGDVIERAKQRQADGKQFDAKDALKILICCGCLGDRSDDANEIVECDGCGVTVHEGCYGVSDAASVSSTVSSCSTEPWFCEACRAGVVDPICELCPNSGGIFKETDVGKWVHLVCALYVPGVAFGEVDRLSSVTLFEMPYSKWGARACCLCEDDRFARTGVCIGCDAGMCRQYFHVTCAQREGLLSEAHSEEVDQADPFYAHCKMHTDKMLMRRRRRNWLALQLRTQQRHLEQEKQTQATAEQQRTQRKLAKYRSKYLQHKSTRIPPWVPTQKMPRLLTTSASAVRRLLQKAELMGVDTRALELQEAQVAALVDVRKKWHIPPAFSVEFIGYYLDRNVRLTSMKHRLEELLDLNKELQAEQQDWRHKYDKLVKENAELSRINVGLKQAIHKYHSFLLLVCPDKGLPSVDEMEKRALPPPVPAPGKGGRGPAPPDAAARAVQPHRSQHHSREGSGSLPLNECGTCRQTTDQHLLAKCDTCHLFYHLGCLNPPLTRMPKKTKLMGWQCSECDKESSGSEVECVDTDAPRKLRHKDASGGSSGGRQSSAEPGAGSSDPQVTPKVTIKPLDPQLYEAAEVAAADGEGADGGSTAVPTGRTGKKRRREKHHRYSPDGEPREHKRKRKRKSFEMDNPDQPSPPLAQGEAPRIKIKIKPIPLPPGEVASPTGAQQMFVATSSTETFAVTSPPQPTVAAIVAHQQAEVQRRSSGASSVTGGGGAGPGSANRRGRGDADVMTRCDVCGGPGSNQNLVRCDECLKCFHFTCLDPPVKKSPKRRGYSWHCADCDPTEASCDA